MIPQSDLATYWNDPARHGFVKPSFDVRVVELDRRSGKLIASRTVYVKAWTHDDATAVAIRYLREMRWHSGGALRVVGVDYSQPVCWV